jgi:hypothetical protein
LHEWKESDLHPSDIETASDATPATMLKCSHRAFVNPSLFGFILIISRYLVNCKIFVNGHDRPGRLCLSRESTCEENRHDVSEGLRDAVAQSKSFCRVPMR